MANQTSLRDVEMSVQTWQAKILDTIPPNANNDATRLRDDAIAAVQAPDFSLTASAVQTFVANHPLNFHAVSDRTIEDHLQLTGGTKTALEGQYALMQYKQRKIDPFIVDLRTFETGLTSAEISAKENSYRSTTKSALQTISAALLITNAVVASLKQEQKERTGVEDPQTNWKCKTISIVSGLVAVAAVGTAGIAKYYHYI